MKYSDQELARNLIARKSLGGKHPPFSKRLKLSYAVWAAVLFIALVFQLVWPDNPVSWLAFGLILGATAREYRWYQASRATWSFHLKVIDWDKVEGLDTGVTAVDDREKPTSR